MNQRFSMATKQLNLSNLEANFDWFIIIIIIIIVIIIIIMVFQIGFLLLSPANKTRRE